MPLTHPYFIHPIIFLRPMADHGPALPSCSITDLGQSMTNRIVLAMVGKVGGITSKCPPFLPYNKIPRHLLKSIRSYVKGTNIYVIRGGGATFEARVWGLERKCKFMRELPENIERPCEVRRHSRRMSQTFPEECLSRFLLQRSS